MNDLPAISGLSGIADRYDALLLDLWGVVHDGSRLYPGVHDALVRLRHAEKKIIMLSNAPRRARKVAAVLRQLGIEDALYDHVVSSGEAGFRWLEGLVPPPVGGRLGGGQSCSSGYMEQESPHPNPPPMGEGITRWGRHYYYIGPDKDADVLDGLEYAPVADLAQAAFLLNVGFGSEEQSDADITPLLRQARALGLPMLCLNPDLEVVKITGERYPCAGVIAHAYKDMGGEVVWFGKPYPAVYEHCMGLLNIPSSLEGEGRVGGDAMESPLPVTPPPAPSLKGRGTIEKARILAVGDSLETDIPGAINFGIDCALVLGGILKEKSLAEITELCRRLNLQPTYTMPRLQW